MSKRRRRRVSRRANVKRSERVKPSALAEAKKKPWPMSILLQRGPEAGGIDAAEFEAALLIVEAFDALTYANGMASMDLGRQHFGGDGAHGPHEMSDREAELGATWLAWADRLPWRAVEVVESINDLRPIVSVPVLRQACQLWARVADDRARARRSARRTTIDPMAAPA